MYTNIQRWENSQVIRLPEVMLDKLGIFENDEVEIVSEDDQIIIKKIKEKKFLTLEERFKDYKGDYDPTSFKWDDPVGSEKI
ncbi:MAG: AbrB/MazE/SpoVT family DNA-binding domain-containing protein [Oscillospiraceae bacterium]|nr:AbrB/MazE/SpoVT family DNA-binding domain-containing protein [Oscillospiraceae bacterium]